MAIFCYLGFWLWILFLVSEENDFTEMREMLASSGFWLWRRLSCYSFTGNFFSFSVR